MFLTPHLVVHTVFMSVVVLEYMTSIFNRKIKPPNTMIKKET